MLNHSLYEALLLPLSSKRLEAYRDESASDLDMLAKYFWNTELSEALYPSLQAFEIALRNSVNAALANHFHNIYWFDQPGLLLDWQVDAVGKARHQLTQHNKPHEPGRIVAELHFGFWHSMFNRPYEEVLWYSNGAELLEAVFPNLPRALRTRKHIWKRIDRIRRLRNRVFHYEPIWRNRDLENLDVIIREMIAAISPPLEAIVALSGHYRETLHGGPQATRAQLVRILGLE